MKPTLLKRRGWALAVGGAVAVAAAIIDLLSTGSPADAVKTLIGAAIAVAVAGLALTLPGITWRGVLIGGFFAVAGVLTWTATSRPIYIWGVLAVAGVVFAIWTIPWFTHLNELRRLATSWLGLPYWVFGVAGALLVAHWTVAAQRLAYAGVFTLAAMAVVVAVRRSAKRGGGDPSVGMVAAILVAVAILLLAGSANMFDTHHAVPQHGNGALLMNNRFWGGLGLFFQPNSMAGLAVVAALRVGPDRAFAWWQRLSVTLVGALVLELTGSRTTWGFALVAALVHAVMVWRRRPDLPAYRRRWVAAVVPVLLLGLVLVVSGGSDFLIKNRFGSGDSSVPPPPPGSHESLSVFLSQVSSGRTETWGQVVSDWRNGGVAQEIFGDAHTSRAVVTRANDPGAQLNTDNAAVGSFRRGGVLGALAFLFGMVLLVVRAVRHRSTGGAPPAAWFTIYALAVAPTILFEDWVLGGTNGSMWLLLMAGEACVLWPPAAAQAPEPLVAVIGPAGSDAAVTAAPEQPVQASAPGLN